MIHATHLSQEPLLARPLMELWTAKRDWHGACFQAARCLWEDAGAKGDGLWSRGALSRQQPGPFGSGSPHSQGLGRGCWGGPSQDQVTWSYNSPSDCNMTQEKLKLQA